MEKYKPNSKCPKCGCNEASTKFAYNMGLSKQVMERKCTRCGYTRNELPLDDEDNNNEKDN